VRESSDSASFFQHRFSFNGMPVKLQPAYGQKKKPPADMQPTCQRRARALSEQGSGFQ